MALLKQRNAYIESNRHDLPSETNPNPSNTNTRNTIFPNPQTQPINENHQDPPPRPTFTGPIKTIKLPSPNQKGGWFNPNLEPVTLGFIPSIPDLNTTIKTMEGPPQHWREMVKVAKQPEYTVEFPNEEDDEVAGVTAHLYDGEESTLALSMTTSMNL